MKDLKNLEGAKMISKKDQKSIKGGIPGTDFYCNGVLCPPGHNCCVDDICGILAGPGGLICTLI